MLTQLRARLDHAGRKDKPIDIFCHSLGARAVMSALALVAQRWPGDPTLARIGRVVITAGACYWGQAAVALAGIVSAGPGRRPQFYNVTAQGDDLLGFLATRATPRAARDGAAGELGLSGPALRLLERGRTIGLHGRPPALNAAFGGNSVEWADIPLDARRTRRWGRRQGFDLRGRRRFSPGDHWQLVTHPGNWALYRAILHRDDGFGAPSGCRAGRGLTSRGGRPVRGFRWSDRADGSASSPEPTYRRSVSVGADRDTA